VVFSLQHLTQVALGSSYSALEEAKADAMGIHNILFLIERGELPESLLQQSLTTYIAGLFRSIRQIHSYISAGRGSLTRIILGFKDL